jgi:hypothetical protein
MPYKDPKKRLEASKKSRHKKPDYYREQAKLKCRQRSKDGYFRKWRYGITQDEFEALIKKQEGLCKLCGNPPSGKSLKSKVLHVDHVHSSGKIRGLLCGTCNRVLGIIEKRDILKKIEGYLENNS